MKRLFPLLALAAVLCPSAPALAAEPAPAWQLDMPHCQIIFQIKHIFAPVLGRFLKFQGQVRYSPDNLAGSMVELTIDTASLDTDITARDNHLRTPEFFDVKRYPHIRFVSTGFEARDKTHFAVKGKLTVKDVTKPVTLVFEHLGTKPNPMKKGSLVAGFRSQFSLDRLEYHVGTGKYFDMGVVGKTVEVFVHLELVRPQ